MSTRGRIDPVTELPTITGHKVTVDCWVCKRANCVTVPAEGSAYRMCMLCGQMYMGNATEEVFDKMVMRFIEDLYRTVWPLFPEPQAFADIYSKLRDDVIEIMELPQKAFDVEEDDVLPMKTFNA
jgi:hypothetical protein